MKHLPGFVAGALIVGAILASGCSGGSSINPPNLPLGGASPTPMASPTATPTPTATPSVSTLHANQGSVLGTPNLFNPTVGDTGTGGSGQVIDGILTCDPTMSDNYHIHIWLGIYVNGTHYALPYAVGMKNPGAPGPPGTFVNTAKCFYHLHTHDSSGIVHVEDTDVSGTPITGTIYTLKSLFDVWGITVNGSQVGQFNGPVKVYTSGQIYRGNMNGGLVSASTYTQWTGDPNTIPLYSHEVIFLEVGPTYPAQLPNISFYTEF